MCLAQRHNALTPVRLTLANIVDPDEMLHYAFHLDFTVCPSTRLGVSDTQRVKHGK